jgi:aspartyl-tRNA(Asn)/glutamyl-tRNA(Gln) amidotransferase subunit A
MMADDFAYRSAVEVAALVRSRAVSPVEVVSATIDRIDRSQPVLNSFITVCAERALADARAAEQALMRGDALGPLHGAPFSVKDMLHAAGVRTTFGSLAFKDFVPDRDALAVARVKAAGAILVGKTTTPEFASGATTQSSLFGRTRNAWRSDRTSGGSSGGAAVSVAAGITPLAVATDSGGSTRIPAACNGVVGMKQTFGLVPDDATPDAFGSLIYINPITRTIEDAALLLQVMAGPHRSDPASLHRVAPDLLEDLQGKPDLVGLRMGWMPCFGNAVVDSDVLRLGEEAVRAFETLGAQVVPFEDEALPSQEAWGVIQNSYRNARYGKFLAAHRDKINATLIAAMDQAKSYTAEQLFAAQFERSAVARKIQAWFEKIDVLVTPTLSRAALAIDHDLNAPIEIEGKVTDTARRAWHPYTLPFNLSGNPAISIPCGWDRDDMPVGIQLVGPWGSDGRLLRIAALLEMVRPWCHRRPRLAEIDRRPDPSPADVAIA